MCLIFLLLISLVPGLFSAEPTHQCTIDSENYCVFDSVNLDETNFEWQPTSNVSASSVKKVKFTKSKIPVFTHSICRTFQSLEELSLSKLGVKRMMDDAFHECLNIKNIICEDNDIEELHWNTFGFNKKLEKLNLAGNKLRNLDVMTFYGMTELETLVLQQNNLTDFSADLLKGNSKVVNLDIEANEISDIDEIVLMSYLPNLKNVYFDLNEIACVRVVEIEKRLRDRGIIAHASKGQTVKSRYYPQEKVYDFTCAPDMSWSAAYYRKSKSGTLITKDDSVKVIQRDINALTREFVTLKEHLKYLEKLLVDLISKNK